MNYKEVAEELAREIIELNPEMTLDELTETFDERMHDIADNAVIYYSEAAKILDDAWGSDITAGEEYLEGIYGEEIFTGCDTYGAVQCRLAYAVVYCRLCDFGDDAVGNAWDAHQAA